MEIPPALNSELFDDYKESIRILYSINDDFKALCDDYNFSKNNLRKLTFDLLQHQYQTLEYQELVLELENEILAYLKKKI